MLPMHGTPPKARKRNILPDDNFRLFATGELGFVVGLGLR
jgi:hypothetical protein